MVPWTSLPEARRLPVLDDLRDGAKFCEDYEDKRAEAYRAALEYLLAAPTNPGQSPRR